MEKETTSVHHMGNFIRLQAEEHESLSEGRVRVWALPALPARHHSYFITEGCSVIKVMMAMSIHKPERERKVWAK